MHYVKSLCHTHFVALQQPKNYMYKKRQENMQKLMMITYHCQTEKASQVKRMRKFSLKGKNMLFRDQILQTPTEKEDKNISY